MHISADYTEYSKQKVNDTDINCTSKSCMIVLHVIMVLSKMNKVEPIARYIAPKWLFPLLCPLFNWIVPIPFSLFHFCLNLARIPCYVCMVG